MASLVEQARLFFIGSSIILSLHGTCQGTAKNILSKPSLIINRLGVFVTLSVVCLHYLFSKPKWNWIILGYIVASVVFSTVFMVASTIATEQILIGGGTATKLLSKLDILQRVTYSLKIWLADGFLVRFPFLPLYLSSSIKIRFTDYGSSGVVVISSPYSLVYYSSELLVCARSSFSGLFAECRAQCMVSNWIRRARIVPTTGPQVPRNRLAWRQLPRLFHCSQRHSHVPYRWEASPSTCNHPGTRG